MTNFEKAYKIVRAHEGGYANDPDDPGGETYKGIARNRWPDWIGWPKIDNAKNEPGFPSNLENDSDLQNDVRNFFKEHFWDAVWGDTISSYSQELATDLFDMAVNLGVGRASEFFQRALNVLNNRGRLYQDISVDGDIGNETIKAFKKAVETRNAELIYKVINILQGYHYINLMESNQKFEKYIGWFKRVDFIQS